MKQQLRRAWTHSLRALLVLARNDLAHLQKHPSHQAEMLKDGFVRFKGVVHMCHAESCRDDALVPVTASELYAARGSFL